MKSDINLDAIKIQARAVQADYEYLNDDLPLKGWAWEFIRRNSEYEALYKELRSGITSLSILQGEADVSKIKDGLLDSPIGSIFLKLITDFKVKVFSKDTYQFDSTMDGEGLLQVLGIPNPIKKYAEFSSKYDIRIAGSASIKQYKFRSDRAEDIEYFKPTRNKEVLEKKCYKIVMKKLVTHHATDTLYLGISLSASKDDIKKQLADILNDHFKTANIRKRSHQWKYYIIVFDLMRAGKNYSEIVGILSQAFNEKTDKLFDEKNMANYHKNALALIAGGYKKYLHIPQ
jgi:hypothetical protein